MKKHRKHTKINYDKMIDAINDDTYKNNNSNTDKMDSTVEIIKSMKLT